MALVRYQISGEFTTDRALTDLHIASLEATLYAQLEEIYDHDYEPIEVYTSHQTVTVSVVEDSE
jgi:hypothetical protein